MPRFTPAPTRALPARPSLAQLRKQAKELLRAYRAGEDAAVAEVGRFGRAPAPAEFALADAQRVLARAYGFPSWAKLHQHVGGANVESFCAAAAAGDIAAVRRLARARPELVNAERGGEFGERAALHFAVLNRDAAMTLALMELGANARQGFWPHRDATAAGTIARERGYDEIAAIIDRAEAGRRAAMSPPGAAIGSKTDAIHEAILRGRCGEAIGILEGDPSLVGACDHGGATPLHLAAWTHDPAMVAWLLDRGAPVDARAPGDFPARLQRGPGAPGRTPLDFAAMSAGWSEHEGGHPFMENARKDPALFRETVRRLRSAGAELTPRAAVATGDREAVLRMHRAGRLGNEIHTHRGGLVAIAVRVGRVDMVSLLLDLGLDPDEWDIAEDGSPRSWGMPLWFASLCGRHEIAGLLLARGADVHGVVYACGDSLCVARDEAMEALLLAHGARLTVEQVADVRVARAILDGSVAASSLDVPEPTIADLAGQMLLGAGGDPEFVAICLPHIARERDDPWWSDALLRAGSPAGFRLMLEHGVDPDVRGGGGYTILHHLATAADADGGVLRATLLLDFGASLRERDAILKSTPLGWACRWGRLPLVQLYLARGADPREPDAEPWATPLGWAEKRGHAAIAALLRAHIG